MARIKKPNKPSVKAAASRPAKIKKREFFVLHYPSGTLITPNDVVSVRNELKSNIKIKKENLRIDLVLHSSGGDVYSAFKIIKTIRDYCSELYVLIPLRAVSAASLLSLGSDKIYLSSQSQMGPLDLPTEHPTIEGSRVSSIDVVQSIAYIEATLKSVASNRFFELRDEMGLGKRDAAISAYNIAVNFLQPLTSKLDPIQTSKSSRDLEIAKIYGKELLRDYMFKNKISPENAAEKTISSLVYKYPAHGFAICYDEAKKIGLVVEKSDDYADWDNVWKFNNEIDKLNKKIIWHLDESQFMSWTK
jgi:hypothetical protein